MNRIVILVLAGFLVPLAARAQPAATFDALLESGIPCPMAPGYGPPPGSADGTARAPAPRVTVVREKDDDLVTIRWTGVSARPLSDEIPIVVEEGSVGLMIRSEAARDLFEISVELLDPRGTLIACRDCPDAPAVGETRPGRGTTQMPSTDRPGWELSPGTYTFRVRATPATDDPVAEVGTDVNVTATLRTDAAVDVDRFLDLNFVYLPGSGLNSESARVSPELADVLARIDEWLEPTGVRIGRVTHKDLNRRGFSFISTWFQAGNLFRSSAALGEPRTMNVYCVKKFEAPLLNVVGLSGGIPGPVASGTADSGIIIRLSPLLTCGSCTDAFASLFVHEFGHYFGLYHTTEANLEAADPFDDTPRCEERDLRRCPDFNHVMFPLIHSANRVWSPGQIAVVQSHPLVYTAPVVGRSPRPAGIPAEAHPNPFRERVDIALDSRNNSRPVRVVIYDVAGRTVRDLGASAAAVSWDGTDADGRSLPDGVYFARVAGGDVARTLRIVKLR